MSTGESASNLYHSQGSSGFYLPQSSNGFVLSQNKVGGNVPIFNQRANSEHWEAMKFSEFPCYEKTSVSDPQKPFQILLDAFQFVQKSGLKFSSPKKEIENQSAGSVEGTNCTTTKRFELVEKPVVDNRSPSSANNDILSNSDFVSVASSAQRGKKFGDRPDVIYKTILRSFKKYYLADFNEITDYKRKKRRASNQTFLLDISSEYAQKKFNDSPFNDIGLFIAALVQPKLPSALENNTRLQELSRTVCEVLYRFNKSKMNELLWYPQFAYILKKFLNMPDILEFIGEKSASPNANQHLKAQITYLEDRCDETLGKLHQANFGEIQNPVFEMPEPRQVKDSQSA